MGVCFNEEKKKSNKSNQYQNNKENFNNKSNNENKQPQIINNNYININREYAQRNRKQNYNDSNNPKGLINLGLSCYMNSLLQCLYYIKELRNYFIKHIKQFNDKPVSQALAQVLYDMKYNEKENIRPEAFKKIMGQKNNLFEGIKAGDAKDLYLNLIDSLLTELINDGSQQSSIRSYNCSDKVQMFYEAEKEVDKKCIINHLFIGYYETEYKCPKNSYIYSFESTSFILFNLENIYKYFNNKQLSIELCFEYYCSEHENTSFFCSHCGKIHTGKSKDKIYRPPKILVIILERGKGKIFRGKVNFSVELNLKKYIDEEHYNYSTNYELIGVITHSGESASSGNYIACCLTDNKKYFYFSDDYKEKIDKNKINFNEPYLLFYQNV